MLKSVVLLLSVAPAVLPAQSVMPGSWDITSTVVEFGVPGVPGFLARTIRGKSKAEHKRLVAGDGVAALLAPDPKAKCRVDDQCIGDGRYSQTLTCPTKQGEPMQIARSGSYSAIGFVGHATVTGTISKGVLRIVLDQRATRVGG